LSRGILGELYMTVTTLEHKAQHSVVWAARTAKLGSIRKSASPVVLGMSRKEGKPS